MTTPDRSVPSASRRATGLLQRINRWTMIPVLRRGLGAWVATPIGGYLLLLRVRGRTSGRLREVPLSYLVADGAAWVVTGSGPSSQWLCNLRAHPAVEIVLPGRRVTCIADEVVDPVVRGRIVPRFARSIGLPGLLGDVNPWRATDAMLIDAFACFPLVRLRPADGSPLGAGPDDPGGRAWLWRQALLWGPPLAGLAWCVARERAGTPSRGR